MSVLNDYHIQFLHHLLHHNVAFMVVRGQARWLARSPASGRAGRPDNNCHQTRDLDIWVSIADGDKPALEQALIDWARAHPRHTNQTWNSPLPLRPKVQIAFPEFDHVWYLDRSGEMKEISTADRIDVLTSLEGMDFDECLKHADTHEVDGVSVYAMSPADLDEAAEHRFRTEGRR
jgi:hypothetical protein